MRFCKNGPWIPDELLVARDEGRVVFFCGSGVSRARANLTDFFGLAEKVIQKLGVHPENTTCKILSEIKELHKRTGENGLISVDRIFGLLERDFFPGEIETAVAEALQPLPDVDLSAHKTLLDLATTQEGKIRLVTTNFDRLFDDCGIELNICQPPKLPDPSRPEEMDGIIYLHGCSNQDYTGSEGDGFILSSSDFGRAYLSEGWATAFFKEIIDRYIVVFVGYSADDPPVYYLLEALNKKQEGHLSGVYAFQSGVSSEASILWQHKGVEAIPYSDEDGHRILWETLEAWAVRARDPGKWYQSVLNAANAGPENLQPYERGQVAHIVSTIEGARKIAKAKPPLPAEWLCVFDPSRRFAEPGYIGEIDSQQTYVDPFDLYCLDSDKVPEIIDPLNDYTKRDIATDAWDAFEANRADRQNLRDDSFAAIRGLSAKNMPTLPSRLISIGVWISQVANQPAAVWWAASQSCLHPFIQARVNSELENSEINTSSVVNQAWQYLFEIWDQNNKYSRLDWYELATEIKKDGWSNKILRKYAIIDRPFLKIERQIWNRVKPPQLEKNIRIHNLLHMNVKYLDPSTNINIPDEWLPSIVRVLRNNLEHALMLEHELGGYGLSIGIPLIDDANTDDYYKIYGLSGRLISFTSLFERLIKFDKSKALQELSAWPRDDDTIFSRLLIWVCGIAELVSVEQFGQVFENLGESAFWDSYHQRDFLLTLKNRWHDLDQSTKKELEDRLLLKKKLGVQDNLDDMEYLAWKSLNRLTWLSDNDCIFTFDFEKEIKRLRTISTEWQPEYATQAINSMQGRGGIVKQDTEYSSLLQEPLDTLLDKAHSLSGRTDDFLVEKDPFAGLINARPVLAFRALSHVAKHNEYPEWAWNTFLNSDSRKDDKPKLIKLIAERIYLYPDETISVLLYPVSRWFLNISTQLSAQFPQTFEKLFTKLIKVLKYIPATDTTTINRGNNQPEWVMEALNAPAGKIAQSLFNDSRVDGLNNGDKFPSDWLAIVETLLTIDGDICRYTIVFLSHNLNWFYEIDAGWTETNLLPILDSKNEKDIEAFWAGFLWSARTPNKDLYLLMKPALLELAKQQNLKHRQVYETLAGMLLAGWGSKNEETHERYISDDEMREVLLIADENFNSRILWQIERWSEGEDDKWSERLVEFLLNVWPRQKSVKTSKISDQLCGLAFSSDKHFPELAKTILPLLTPIDRDYLMFPELQDSENTIIEQYPEQTLEILHVVLPNNISAWPYDIEETFQKICEADSSLSSDARLLELKRKWNAR